MTIVPCPQCGRNLISDGERLCAQCTKDRRDRFKNMIANALGLIPKIKIPHTSPLQSLIEREKTRPVSTYAALSLSIVFALVYALVDIPKPTKTRAATAPVKEAVEASFSPVSLTGHGSSVKCGVFLPNGYYKISYYHSGEHNFAVKAVVPATKHQRLLVNEIGFKMDETGWMVRDNSDCCFEVDADGDWRLNIFRQN